MSAQQETQALESLLRQDNKLNIELQFGPLKDVVAELINRIEIAMKKVDSIPKSKSEVSMNDIDNLNRKIYGIMKDNAQQMSDYSCEIRELKQYFSFQLKDLREKIDRNIKNLATTMSTPETPREKAELIPEAPGEDLQNLTSEIDVMKQRFDLFSSQVNNNLKSIQNFLNKQQQLQANPIPLISGVPSTTNSPPKLLSEPESPSTVLLNQGDRIEMVDELQDVPEGQSDEPLVIVNEQVSQSNLPLVPTDDPRIADILLQLQNVDRNRKSDQEKVTNIAKTVNKVIIELDTFRKENTPLKIEVSEHTTEFERLYEKMAAQSLETEKLTSAVSSDLKKLTEQIEADRIKINKAFAEISKRKQPHIPDFGQTFEAMKAAFTENLKQIDNNYRQQIHYLKNEISSLKAALSQQKIEVPETQEEPEIVEYNPVEITIPKTSEVTISENDDQYIDIPLLSPKQITKPLSKPPSTKSLPKSSSNTSFTPKIERSTVAENVSDKNQNQNLDQNDQTEIKVEKEKPTVSVEKETESIVKERRIPVSSASAHFEIDVSDAETQTDLLPISIPIERFSVGVRAVPAGNVISSMDIATFDNTLPSVNPTPNETDDVHVNQDSNQKLDIDQEPISDAETKTEIMKEIGKENKEERKMDKERLPVILTVPIEGQGSEFLEAYAATDEGRLNSSARSDLRPSARMIFRLEHLSQVTVTPAPAPPPQVIFQLPDGAEGGDAVSALQDAVNKIIQKSDDERFAAIGQTLGSHREHINSLSSRVSALEMNSHATSPSRSIVTITNANKIPGVDSFVSGPDGDTRAGVITSMSTPTTTGASPFSSTADLADPTGALGSRAKSTVRFEPPPLSPLSTPTHPRNDNYDNYSTNDQKDNSYNPNLDMQKNVSFGKFDSNGKPSRSPSRNSMFSPPPIHVEGDITSKPKPIGIGSKGDESSTVAQVEEKLTNTIRALSDLEKRLRIVEVSLREEKKKQEEFASIPLTPPLPSKTQPSKPPKKSSNKYKVANKEKKKDPQIDLGENEENGEPETTNIDSEDQSQNNDHPMDVDLKPPKTTSPRKDDNKEETEEKNDQEKCESNQELYTESSQEVFSDHNNNISIDGINWDDVAIPRYDDQFRVFRDAIIDLRNRVQIALSKGGDQPIVLPPGPSLDLEVSKPAVDEGAFRSLRKRMDSQMKEIEESIADVRRELYTFIQKASEQKPEKVIVERIVEKDIQKEPKPVTKKDEKPPPPPIELDNPIREEMKRKVMGIDDDSPRVLKISTLDVPPPPDSARSPKSPIVKPTTTEPVKPPKPPRKTLKEAIEAAEKNGGELPPMFLPPDVPPPPAASQASMVSNEFKGRKVPQPTEDISVTNAIPKQDILETMLPYMIDLRTELDLKVEAAIERMRVAETTVQDKADKASVEMFFRKMRAKMTELADRVQVVQQVVPDRVTRDDLRDFADELYRTLSRETQTPAGSVTCLFCGAKRNSVSGQIIDRNVADALGEPPQARVGRSTMMFGSDRAMYRGKGNFGRTTIASSLEKPLPNLKPDSPKLLPEI